MKVWKTITNLNYDNSKDLLSDLKKKNFKTSPWIDDIFGKKKIDLTIIKLPINLYRVSLKDLNFNKQTELEKVYEKAKKLNLKPVDPVIALVCRELYLDQPKGEWLRFATPFNSMIDSDGVPHIPKLGKALNLFFIETYWSYPQAIFHPHNEFIFCK
jgi:hypothetical protein